MYSYTNLSKDPSKKLNQVEKHSITSATISSTHQVMLGESRSKARRLRRSKAKVVLCFVSWDTGPRKNYGNTRHGGEWFLGLEDLLRNCSEEMAMVCSSRVASKNFRCASAACSLTSPDHRPEDISSPCLQMDTAPDRRKKLKTSLLSVEAWPDGQF